MTVIDVIGFGSLNLDEFWEVPPELLVEHGLRAGEEYIRDSGWFVRMYELLRAVGSRKAADPGGSAANTIAALRRMGFRTGFYGAAGETDRGALRLDELGERENLRIAVPALHTGRCLAMINHKDAGRDRALVIVPNANDFAGVDGMDFEYFSDAKWVHLTSFVSTGPLDVQIALVQNLGPGTRISFDPGAVYVRLGLPALTPIIRRTAVLFVSVEELCALSGRHDPDLGAADLLEAGAATVVVKMGADGIRAFDDTGSIFQEPVAPRRIVDRTGAGDVAAAGFLAGLLEGLEPKIALLLAATAASKSIEGYGRSAYPDQAFLMGFLDVHCNHH
jgi:ribokinase